MPSHLIFSVFFSGTIASILTSGARRSGIQRTDATSTDIPTRRPDGPCAENLESQLYLWCVRHLATEFVQLYWFFIYSVPSCSTQIPDGGRRSWKVNCTCDVCDAWLQSIASKLTSRNTKDSNCWIIDASVVTLTHRWWRWHVSGDGQGWRQWRPHEQVDQVRPVDDVSGNMTGWWRKR